ncbi:MAG TPA: precorrin-8X methylmutase [Coleofasciculaceae cyanobacterium]
MAPLTIKELTETVGGVTPRMVRHYHQLGLLPQAQRSPGNYRLYTEQDVQRLRRIVALKQQGFQLSHIQQVLETQSLDSPAVDDAPDSTDALTAQLQRQYQTVIQQLVRLRHTAAALEGLLGRDRHCQLVQAEALAQLRLFEAETQAEQGGSEALWHNLDAAASHHPENFQDALQRLLPDLSDRSEIEIDLLTQLVLSCGDVSLVPFIQISQNAIKAARESLTAGCPIVCDVPIVAAALDQTRLAHLGCSVSPLIHNPHIHSAAEAEQSCWQAPLPPLPAGCIVVVGYAPSVLLKVCEAIESQQAQPALVIGMPVGFSHAPAAKRRLMKLAGHPSLFESNASSLKPSMAGVTTECVTTEGTLGGGLLAAVALNALAQSLIEKPDCHCYLSKRSAATASPAFCR